MAFTFNSNITLPIPDRAGQNQRPFAAAITPMGKIITSSVSSQRSFDSFASDGTYISSLGYTGNTVGGLTIANGNLLYGKANENSIFSRGFTETSDSVTISSTETTLFTHNSIRNTKALIFDGTHYYGYNSTSNLLYKFDTSGSQVATLNYSGTDYQYGFLFNSKVYFGYDNNARAYTEALSRDTDNDILLPNDSDGNALSLPRSGEYYNNKLYIVGLNNKILTIYDEVVSQATATITFPMNFNAGTTSQVSITTDEDVTGFDNDDITVAGATEGMLMGTGASYVLPVTVASSFDDVSVTVTIREDAFTEGNDETEATATATANLQPVTFGITPPSSPRAGSTVNATVTFSSAVTGFDAADVTVTGGSLGTITTTNNIAFNLPITIPSNENDVMVTIQIRENAVNERNAAGSESFTATANVVDVATPTISYPLSISAGSTITVTFTWDETVTGFGVSDLTVTGGTLSGFSGSGTTYTASMSIPDSTSDRLISITIRENAVDQNNLILTRTATATANQARPTTTVTDVNSSIFTSPSNYDRQTTMGSDIITEITDNNALTYYQTDVATPIINFQIHGTTVNDSTNVDSLFLVTTNVASFTLSVAAGGSSETLISGSPNALQDGLQYSLYTADTLSGTTASLSLTKTDANQPIRIYQCMIMERLWLFPDGSFSFDGHGWRSEKRGSQTKTALDYSISRTTPLLNYNKHRVTLRSAKLNSEETKLFFDAIEPHNNFTFAFEYPKYSKMVFVGIFAEDIGSAYRTNWSGGRLSNDLEIVQS